MASESAAQVRVAFDSRPSADPRGVGRYARCLLRALRDTADARGEIVETHRPRRADVYHAPWMQGAMLRSPCPMVVTIHDLDALTRPSERLRGGGIHSRLRHLAVQRATHVIVPTEALAHEAIAELGFERERVVVIPEAPDPVMDPRSDARSRACVSTTDCRSATWCGSAACAIPTRASTSPNSRATPRELPLVLVGPTRPWAHELPDVILTGHVPDEHLAAIYAGAHALVLASETRDSACPRSRRWRAARRSWHARSRRCARCWTTARRSWSRATCTR